MTEGRGGTTSETTHNTRRGMHHVYLGYAVGVGKTRAMLSEARRLSKHHVDVVIGFLEPHGRADIVADARRIERLQPQRVEYKGVVFEELDVDAALARRPAWLLVDELAHEVTPGAAHDWQWQTVETLLDAGINVISTLNVQHVESLNDFVYQVTGIRVAETVPDRILDDADRIVLVDLPPDQLIARVRRGTIYGPDEIGPALTHFFRRSSLEALRGEALRLAQAHAEKAISS